MLRQLLSPVAIVANFCQIFGFFVRIKLMKVCFDVNLKLIWVFITLVRYIRKKSVVVDTNFVVGMITIRASINV